jgi:hypothetical protein
MRIGWIVILGWLAQAGMAAAQEPPGPPAPGAPAAPTDVTIDRADKLAVGIGFSGPMGAAASLRLLHGLSADVREEGERVRAVCALPIPHCGGGFLLQLDAGSGGGKLSVGVGGRARVEQEDFRGTVGAALRASLLRTWGNPIGTEPGLTYLGPEFDVSIVRVNLSAGVLWRVSGPGGDSVVFSWGLGFGL